MRKINWNNKNWEILDRFSGGAEDVEIGFNFKDCSYSLEQNAHTLTLPWGKIVVSENTAISVKDHRVSQYYLQSRVSKRLIISLKNNSELITTIKIY